MWLKGMPGSAWLQLVLSPKGWQLCGETGLLVQALRPRPYIHVWTPRAGTNPSRDCRAPTHCYPEQLYSVYVQTLTLMTAGAGRN